MELIADLHLHSKYSRAVSPQMVIPEISRWAAKKGIGLVGTADWTHPLWLRELKENLEEVGEGLYGLKEVGRRNFDSAGGLKSVVGSASLQTQASLRPSASGYARYQTVPGLVKTSPHDNPPRPPFFLLSTEIASIYTQNGKSHRIHNLVLVPNFSIADKINDKLRSRGVNLFSDGRPMTGLSSPALCELVFSVSEDCLVIPAHVWTPWYSLYGSSSGFDSLEECFGKFSDRIYAVETGLSSDPAMNWRIEELDKRSIVSFSDAHSPVKLGREATVLEVEKLSFKNISLALRSSTTGPAQNRILYTIEFYPEEGKYHWTGHRACGVKQSPEETKKLGTTCPVCGRKLTVGVMHRVDKLSTRNVEYKIENGEVSLCWIRHPEKKRPPYVMLVPLVEILAEALGIGVSSQNVASQYDRLIVSFGSEFNVLLKAPLEAIKKIVGEKVAEGIDRVRQGEIVVEPGYDGVFGTVKIWPSDSVQNRSEEKKQMSLF